MKQQLSILIPVYCAVPAQQVDALRRQADAIDGLDYEIVLADDGSPADDGDGHPHGSAEQLWQLAEQPHVRVDLLQQNVGRARIRNHLARLARHEWLLFLDCDMGIPDGFVQRYVEADGADVFDGGVRIGQGPADNLRWRYEKAAESAHTAAERSKRPHQHFHTANFMVRRSVVLAHPFCEQMHGYGYEDVLFGKQLHRAGIAIAHIDNPALFDTFDDNEHFVAKTEEALRTLHRFRSELRGYSSLLTFVDGIHLGMVRGAFRLWHCLFGPLERRHLCGRHPSLRVFNLYKLGYFLRLK